jgi:hypothetical protein
MADVELIGGDRPVRVCDVCGGVDDHPRHSIAGGPGAAGPPLPEVVKAVIANTAITDDQKAAALVDLMDDSSQQRHMDCCRRVGCPSGTCNHVADLGGVDGVTGAGLLTVLVDNRDALQERAEAKAIAEHDAQRAALAAADMEG